MKSNRIALTILTILLVLTAGCNLPFDRSEEQAAPGTDAPAAQPGDPVPTFAAPAPASVIYMPQQMDLGSSFNSEPGSAALRYMWPASLPPGWVIVKEKSYADESGFSLELSSPTVQVTVMGGDIAAPAWDLAVQKGTTAQVRGASGYAFDTSSGYTLHWLESGQYYVAGGVGLGLAEAQALVAGLEPLNLAEFQARLAQ
jgi:hypothetical protein